MSTDNNKKFKYQSYHYRAIELRYQGLTYKDLGDVLHKEFPNSDFGEKKVARWFGSGGILESLYIDYAKKENDRRRQEIRQKFIGLVADVPDALKIVLKNRIVRDPFGNTVIDKETGKPAIKYDSTTVKAAEAILKAAGVDISSIKDDEAYDEVMERLEELADEKLNDQSKT